MNCIDGEECKCLAKQKKWTFFFSSSHFFAIITWCVSVVFSLNIQILCHFCELIKGIACLWGLKLIQMNVVQVKRPKVNLKKRKKRRELMRHTL